jgi:hypothetical protein
MNDENKEAREAAAQRSACVCKTPLVKHVDKGVFICATCGKGLMVDDEGKPYRRLRGDLDTPEQRMGRDTLEAAKKAKDEMMELVVQLPTRQKEYLLRLSKMKPRKFAKEARRLIRVHFAALESEKEGRVKPGPNAQRRLQREMADAVDMLAPNSGLAGSIGGAETAAAIPLEHAEHCGICDTEYDRRELDQVIYHAGGHQLAEATGIIGERTDEQAAVLPQEFLDGLAAISARTEPLDPVDCPRCDPDCEGGDGDCHDACERPEPDAAQIARDAASRHAIEQATARATEGNEPRVKCHLCGLMKHPTDHEGHGLGDCVDICEKCGGSGEGRSHGGETDAPDPCDHCSGSGAEPPRSVETPRAHRDYIDAITYSGPNRRAEPRIIPPENIDPAEPGGDRTVVVLHGEEPNIEGRPKIPPPPIAPPARTILAGLGIKI